MAAATGDTKSAFETLDRAAETAKQEVYIAVGQVTLSWNKLHESLAYLFAAVIQTRRDAAFAIWHSQVSDRAQREMLRAASIAYQDQYGPKIIAEVDWILKKSDALAKERNSAIHTHFSLRIDNGEILYLPDEWSGSKHARKLSGKDPLDEFRECSEWAHRLSQYAIEIRERVLNPRDSSPWPKQPERRRVRHSTARKVRR